MRRLETAIRSRITREGADFKFRILLGLWFGWAGPRTEGAPSLVRVLHNKHLKEC
jgi:hypothetical protein